MKDDAIRNRTLLPASHPAVQLVRRVGLQIVKQTAEGMDRGAYGHMQACLLQLSYNDKHCLDRRRDLLSEHVHNNLVSTDLHSHIRLHMQTDDDMQMQRRLGHS